MRALHLYIYLLPRSCWGLLLAMWPSRIQMLWVSANLTFLVWTWKRGEKNLGRRKRIFSHNNHPKFPHNAVSAAVNYCQYVHQSETNVRFSREFGQFTNKNMSSCRASRARLCTKSKIIYYVLLQRKPREVHHPLPSLLYLFGSARLDLPQKVKMPIRPVKTIDFDLFLQIHLLQPCHSCLLF